MKVSRVVITAVKEESCYRFTASATVDFENGVSAVVMVDERYAKDVAQMRDKVAEALIYDAGFFEAKESVRNAVKKAKVNRS